MRNLNEIDNFRRKNDPVVKDLYGFDGDETCGVFDLPSPRTGTVLMCVASTEFGWDHVSVSLKNRCPNWIEMEYVKRTFFLPEETAMQLHVPVKDHINIHENVLHIWRPNDGREIPRPPSIMI